MENLKETLESVPNILENGSPLELESMLKNAIRFYGRDGKHNIKPKTIYSLNMKFAVDGNYVGISDLNIAEKFGKSSLPQDNSTLESPIDEKYNEYDSLMNTPEMNRKTLGDVIKRKISDTKIELTRKPAKALL